MEKKQVLITKYNQILIKYGEIILKKKNRNFFINKLVENIKFFVLENEIFVYHDRIALVYSQKNFEVLENIFGIENYAKCYRIFQDLYNDQSFALLEKYVEFFLYDMLVNEKKSISSFAFRVKKNDQKIIFKSNETEINLAKFVYQKFPFLKVNLTAPDITFFIEMTRDGFFIFHQKQLGLGGLPVGVSGKALHLISGGIDSPVAAFLTMKRGLEITLISFISFPHTDAKTIEKIHKLHNLLQKYQPKMQLILVSLETVLEYIKLIEKKSYRIILLRRSFYRIATKIAQKLKIDALSNGENLGQVASQTIKSLNVICHDLNILVIRPLICMDKKEIVVIAKQIKTYPISAEKSKETCEQFAPPNPITKPILKVVFKLEKHLFNLADLEQEIIKKIAI